MLDINLQPVSVTGYVILVLIALAIIVLCGIIYFLRRASRVRQPHSNSATLRIGAKTLDDCNRLYPDVHL